MRPMYAIALIAAILVGVTAFERITRFDPGDDAVVRALTTEPVRVTLDFSPNVDEVRSALAEALTAAAHNEQIPEVVTELESMADDESFIQDISEVTIGRLRTDAAALAYSTTTVDGSGNIITIVGITIEMLPMGRRDGLSRDHEDGHAQINNGIIERCASAIVSFEIDAGRTGSTLVARINDHIALLEDHAHAQYHVDVSDSVFGSHGRAAGRAIEAIERGGCIAFSS